MNYLSYLSKVRCLWCFSSFLWSTSYPAASNVRSLRVECSVNCRLFFILVMVKEVGVVLFFNHDWMQKWSLIKVERKYGGNYINCFYVDDLMWFVCGVKLFIECIDYCQLSWLEKSFNWKFTQAKND